MGPGLSALLVFVALIVIWAVVLKRNITEAALISLTILPFFGGVDQAPSLMLGGITYALNHEVLFASMAFVFMSFLLQNSNVLTGMLKIFTRLFGRLKGGPAYVNTAISSVLGCLSGGNSPNAATSGAFTAEWLLKSGWKREEAATLIAANGGLASGFPPSSSLFIVLGFPTVAGLIFVFGQALCIVLGQPEWIIQLENSVDGVIFPAIAITGLLCWIYSLIWKPKKSDD